MSRCTPPLSPRLKPIDLPDLPTDSSALVKLWKGFTDLVLSSYQTSNTSEYEIEGDNLFDGLPTELLQVIFNYCLVEVHVSLYETIYHCQQIAIMLSQVCKRWREISLAMPQLWAYVFINSKKVAFDQLCLQRSGTSPLCLTPLNYDTSVTRIFSEASAHISRWRAIEIDMNHCSLKGMTELKELEGKSSPHLELVKISGTDEIALRPPAQKLGITRVIFSIMSTSPNIRRLYWNNLPFPSPMDVSILSQLTLISMTDVGFADADDYIRCLSMCKSATDIKFTSLYGVEKPKALHQITALPWLKKLHLDLPMDVGTILQYFSLPQLKELDIQISQFGGTCDWNALNQFHEQSSCNLTELRINFFAKAYLDKCITLYLGLSWLASIPRVTFYLTMGIHSNQIMTEKLTKLLSGRDISPDVKDKLIAYGAVLGWGL
ncbi:hypothetical protein BDQ17DRAFT_1542314 [Cyathus striatus]|nr:hypothetical protein BDQ17DRAFT_1542314 [Cyathus striatus]